MLLMMYSMLLYFENILEIIGKNVKWKNLEHICEYS